MMKLKELKQGQLFKFNESDELVWHVQACPTYKGDFSPTYIETWNGSDIETAAKVTYNPNSPSWYQDIILIKE